MATIQLNPRFKYVLLRHMRSNTRRSNTLLQRGFTLVELMIVIVIVGILSAVALPNFLSQTSKAKATECTTKLGGMLSQAGAEGLTSLTAANELLTSLVAEGDTNSDLCDFGFTAAAAGSKVLDVTVIGKGDLAGKYAAKGCVNFETGKRDIKTGIGALVDVAAPACV